VTAIGFMISRIPTPILEHLDGCLGGSKQEVFFAGSEPERFESFFLGSIFEAFAVGRDKPFFLFPS